MGDGFKTVDAKLYSSSSQLIGTIFEQRYRIEELIGRGGMGRVYRAKQLAVQRDVAIKILRRDMVDELREVVRFQREARALAALNHPNITAVHDFGQTQEGDLYLVLEYLQGEELADRLRDGRSLAPQEVRRIAIEVLDALADAHHQGVVHRDLKPHNIFLTKQGRKTDVVKLLDFGIAKMFEDQQAADGGALTATGVTIGSPRYMSPEQALGHPITPQTDLYSLGATLFEMLAGTSVFDESSPTGYMLAHINKEPKPPTRDGEPLSGPLVDLIMEMLQKDPTKRPPSADTTLARLRAMEGALVTRGSGVNAAAVVDAPAARAAAVAPLYPSAPQDDLETDNHGNVQSAVTMHAPSIAEAAGPMTRAIEDNVMTTAVPTIAPGGGREFAQPMAADQHTGSRKVWVAAFVLLLGGFGYLVATSLGGDKKPASGVKDDTAAAKVADSPNKAGGGGTETKKAADEGDTKPAEDTGPKLADDEFSVQLKTKPDGAAVIVKGKEIGKTPFDLIWKKTHKPPTVRLKAEGYETLKVKVLLTDAGNILEVQLEPKPQKKSKKK